MQSWFCRVTRTRASKVSEVAFVGIASVALVGCVEALASAEAVQSSGGAEASSGRRPDAVVLELPPAIPSAVGMASAHGVIALRERSAGDSVEAIVKAVVGALQRGSVEEFANLLAVDAGPIDSPQGGRENLIERWRQLLRGFPSTGQWPGIAPSERVERYSWDDLAAPSAPPRPSRMRIGDLYVRVPIEAVVGGDPSEPVSAMVLLVLSREGGSYKVFGFGVATSP